MDRFVAAYNKGTLCQEFVPKPEDIGDGWYDWCASNWGTKWDVGADEGTEREEFHGLKATVVENEACCSFDSAWAPPAGLYEKLDELGYKVHASYFEPGMCFCGVWTDGYDNCIQYTDKDMIPVGIWNDFGLEEFFEDEVEAS
jgi:hypothetical protein